MAVVDISQPRSVVKGFVPTGWYPTGVTTLPGDTLAILNGKGLGSRANPDGPVPTQPNQPLYQGGPVVSPGYVGHIQTGTVAFLPPIADDQLQPVHRHCQAQLSLYRRSDLWRPSLTSRQHSSRKTENHPSPIQHVIYVIKENRTYDQVLG